MSNFWRAKQPITEMTIGEFADLMVLGGILANPRIDENMPPDIIVDWCEGVSKAYQDRVFGPPGQGSGLEVIAEFEHETGMSYVDLINERLAEVRGEQSDDTATDSGDNTSQP